MSFNQLKSNQKAELKRDSTNAIDLANTSGSTTVILGPAPLPVKVASISGLINFVRKVL